MTYATLREKESEALVAARHYRALAEDAQADAVRQGGIMAWRDYRFTSSSGLTQEWEAFSRQMRAYLKKTLAPDFELVSYSRGHFYFSAFLKNIETGKLAYISCSDVRFFPNEWAERLLIRTAKHDKDYTGGVNCSSSLDELKQKVQELTR